MPSPKPTVIGDTGRLNPHVTHVQPQDDFTLIVTFATGERRRFDVAPFLDTGVFQRLRERSVFEAAKVVAGSVEWPGEVDLSYDTLYMEGAGYLGDSALDQCGGRPGTGPG
ncbi:MAG: DUF2442 domain-containing protein [Gammaproteobacteria bacterium]|nr:DUF2442 domain-containing protein [Gammaproteobacteria bacterium]